MIATFYAVMFGVGVGYILGRGWGGTVLQMASMPIRMLMR